MNINRINLVLRAGVAAVACSAALIGAATPAHAAAGAAASTTCSWTADQLPRTPDAIEGWYADCRSRTAISPRLGSPDATEAWND